MRNVEMKRVFNREMMVMSIRSNDLKLIREMSSGDEIIEKRFRIR